MFTGLVAGQGVVTAVEVAPDGSGARLTVTAPWLVGSLSTGDSVAVSGCCLTVTRVATAAFEVGLVAETLRRTTLGDLQPGARVNLEPAVRAGAPLGGHLVQGHVDGVGTVRSARAVGAGRELEVRLPVELARYLVEKGSVTVDGVSLTVTGVGPDWFGVALVGHTVEMTTLGECRAGDRVQLEVDVIAKYVERLLGSSGAAAPDGAGR